MAHSHFSAPIFLKLHRTGNFQARTRQEAVEYLKHFWPAERTVHYRQAKVLCHAALDGIVEPETARVALIDAAHRAGILANGRGVDGVMSNTSYVSDGIAWGNEARVENDELEVTETDLIGYYRARDILDDVALSPSRKRALLAYWASDMHAVAGSPSLRNIRGVAVTVDSILDALCSLDAEIDQAAMNRATTEVGQSW